MRRMRHAAAALPQVMWHLRPGSELHRAAALLLSYCKGEPLLFTACSCSTVDVGAPSRMTITFSQRCAVPQPAAAWAQARLLRHIALHCTV